MKSYKTYGKKIKKGKKTKRLSLSVILFMLVVASILYVAALQIIPSNSQNSGINIKNNTQIIHLNMSNTGIYNSTSLLAYYPLDFDNGTAIFDYGPNNWTLYKGLTNVSFNLNTSCVYGKCMRGQDAVQYFAAQTNQTIGDVGTIFTVSFWVKGDNLTDNGYGVIGKFNPTNNGWIMRFVNNNPRIFVDGSGVTFNDLTVPNGQWTHVVMGENGSTNNVFAYVNGVRSVATGAVPTFNPAVDYGPYNFTIGRASAFGGAVQFNGTLDEVMLFNVALNDSDVLSIYRNQSSRFAASVGNVTYTARNIGNSTVNITLGDCLMPLASNISVRINGGADSYFDPTTCRAQNYVIAGNNTAANVTISLNSSANQFYSPFFAYNLSFDGGSAQASVGSIAISYPLTYQIYQRNSTGKANITIYGNYTGSPTSINATFAGSAPQTIVTSPSGGTFVGTFVNAGSGQGNLTVYFTNNVSINSTTEYIGVGDIYVIAGASNAQGPGINLFTSNTSNPYKNVAWNVSTNVSWVLGNDPMAPVAGIGTGGSWMVRLSDYLSQRAGVPIGILPTAVGATMITQWDGEGSGYFLNMKSILRVATNGTYNVKGMIYESGGNECNAGLSNATLVAAHLVLGQAWLNLTNTSVYLTVKEPRLACNQTALDTVRRAQMEVISGYSTYFKNGGFLQIVPVGDDGVHLNYDIDLIRVAQTIFYAIANDSYGFSDGRGPRLSSAQFTNSSNTTILLNFTDETLPLTRFTPSWTTANESIKGFTFQDLGSNTNLTDLNVSNASIYSSNQLIIYLRRATSGNITISYASNESAYNVTTFADSAVLQVINPLSESPIAGFDINLTGEPFYNVPVLGFSMTPTPSPSVNSPSTPIITLVYATLIGLLALSLLIILAGVIIADLKSQEFNPKVTLAKLIAFLIVFFLFVALMNYIATLT